MRKPIGENTENTDLCVEIAVLSLSCSELAGFVRMELERKGLADDFPVLERRLRTFGGLVMLDGLDEVPNSGERRERLIRCVDAFAGNFGEVWLLVTCRSYAYEQASWHIRGFSEPVPDPASGQRTGLG